MNTREQTGLKEHQEYPTVEADTIPKYFKMGKDRWGDRVCMRRKNLGIWQQYTWNDVYDHVRRFSLGLMSLGLRAGDTVAIAGENEPEMFWADYAALCTGAKAVCLYPDMTPPEIQYILEHSEAIFFIAEDQEQVDKFLEIRDQLPNVRRVVYWDSSGMWQYDDPLLIEFKAVQELGDQYDREYPDLFDSMIAQGKGDDIALLSYTSGTTGLPKGVILTHNYLLDNAFRVIMANEFKPFTHYLSYLSPAWVTEHFFVAIGMLVPFTYNFPEEPETVLSNIRELGAEVLVFGPRQWESLASLVQARMLDAGPIRRMIYNAGMKVGYKKALERTEGQPAGPLWNLLHPLAELFVLGAIRDNLGLKKTYFALTGGAPTAPDVFRFYHAMGLQLRNIYGSTEMGVFSQHTGGRFDPETLGRPYQSHPAFGPPLENQVDANGGLMLRGGSGFVGYYKNPEATQKARKGDWFITGDATRINDAGDLVFLDRVADLKKLSTGHLFPPQFIETRLRFSPFIKDAIVLGDETTPFVAALINIDSETVGRWAERQGIAFTTFPDLSQKSQVCDLIQTEILRVNQALETPSRVHRFANLPKEFDPDEAELTRTRKLRREFLEDRYGKLIAAIYSDQQTFVTEVPVKYRDGRTGMVTTETRLNTIPKEG
jgi:long-chain acyl-CoA synthetase